MHDEQVASSGVVFQSIANLADSFAAQGITNFLLLKDTGLSLVAYPCPSCRKAKDVDILVPKEVFPRLSDLVARHGFRLDHEDPYGRPRPYLMEVSGQQEFTKTQRDQLVRLEFHHRPHSGMWIRPQQEPDPSDLFRRALSVALHGTKIKVLGYEDNLLHLCVHAAKHFFVLDKPIRMYVDIDRLVATEKVDWETFVELAQDHRVALPALIALRISRELLLTEIPASVFDALRGSPWRERIVASWVHRLGVFEPSEQKLSRSQRFLFYGLLVDSWRDSLATIRRIFLPSLRHIKLRYGFASNLLAPAFYLWNAFRIVVLRRL